MTSELGFRDIQSVCLSSAFFGEFPLRIRSLSCLHHHHLRMKKSFLFRSVFLPSAPRRGISLLLLTLDSWFSWLSVHSLHSLHSWSLNPSPLPPPLLSPEKSNELPLPFLTSSLVGDFSLSRRRGIVPQQPTEERQHLTLLPLSRFTFKLQSRPNWEEWAWGLRQLPFLAPFAFSPSSLIPSPFPFERKSDVKGKSQPEDSPVAVCVCFSPFLPFWLLPPPNLRILCQLSLLGGNPCPHSPAHRFTTFHHLPNGTSLQRRRKECRPDTLLIQRILWRNERRSESSLPSTSVAYRVRIFLLCPVMSSLTSFLSPPPYHHLLLWSQRMLSPHHHPHHRHHHCHNHLSRTATSTFLLISILILSTVSTVTAQYKPQWPDPILSREIFVLNLEDGFFGCQVNESTDFLQLFELSKLCDGNPQCFRGSDELSVQLKCTDRSEYPFLLS